MASRDFDKTDSFAAYERIPLALCAPEPYPFPVSLRDFRCLTITPNFEDSEHRKEVHLLIRKLFLHNQRLQFLASEYLRRAGLDRIIQYFFAQRRESFPPDYVDLFYLYCHVRRHRPRQVLEFGSGLSTAVIAAALALNGEGRLISVEHSKKWADSTTKCLPPELLARAEVVHRQAIPVDCLGSPTYCFEAPPIDTADMIYIDGQADAKSLYHGAENIEYLSLPPGAYIFIDSRWNAVSYFRKKNRLEPRFEIASYAIFVRNFHADVTQPFGTDFFCNTRVRVA